MQVLMNIDEKIYNVVAAQLMLQATDKNMEKSIENATNRCKNEVVQIDPNLLEEEAQNVQMGLCMLGLACVAEEELQKINDEENK